MIRTDIKKSFSSRSNKGQSALEIAIFGSILIFVISLIFRQGLSGGNFMSTQLKATRYALSKSFEMSLQEKPGRNSSSVLVIEDRLSGDFANKYGSRDRVPLVAGGGGSYSNQLFFPVNDSDCDGSATGSGGDWKATGLAACDIQVLPHYDVWINGQRFSFLTSMFRIITLPDAQGTMITCGQPHPTDTRCWDPACKGGTGCVILRNLAENYPNSSYTTDPGVGSWDLNNDGTDPVAAAGIPKNLNNGAATLNFMWQWQNIQALGSGTDNFKNDIIDVDGDYYPENILDSTEWPSGRTKDVLVIDRQAGDIDFTVDGRRPNAEMGLLKDSQMFSFTKSGTVYKLQEGKLLNANTNQFIRNVNMNDHVDIVQRTFQLSNDLGRFCNGNNPQAQVDGVANPVEACNNCFSAVNVQLTCFETSSLKLFVRSRIVNQAGHSWFTRTEVTP